MVSPLALLFSGTACGNSPAEFLEVQLEFDGRGTAIFDSAPGEKPFRQRCAWDDPAPCDVFSEDGASLPGTCCTARASNRS